MFKVFVEELACTVTILAIEDRAVNKIYMVPSLIRFTSIRIRNLKNDIQGKRIWLGLCASEFSLEEISFRGVLMGGKSVGVWMGKEG